MEWPTSDFLYLTLPWPDRSQYDLDPNLTWPNWFRPWPHLTKFDFNFDLDTGLNIANIFDFNFDLDPDLNMEHIWL